MRRLPAVAFVVALFVHGEAGAQPLFTEAFPPEEFASRRARVMASIGDGVAVLQGAAEWPAYQKFRQNNQFFYLTGVEVPRALLIVDGRTQLSTLFLPPRDEHRERSEGPVLVPGPDAERTTGIERVVSRDEFAAALTEIAAARRRVHTPFRPESRGAATPQHAVAHAKASTSDPWDGRPSREEAFIERLRQHGPQLAIEDLDSVLDRMRLVKSAREIVLIREATRLAGLAAIEAMRSTRAGLYEYQLEAIGDFTFKQHNAQGVGYHALVAGGRNAFFPHYHAAQDRLSDGDLVLFDYAPDLQYYTADVTRQFPVNGKFSARQREIYTIYLRLYDALMTSIRPRATPRAIIEDAHRKMESVLASFHFSEPRIRDAASRMVATFKAPREYRLGHWVGMEVHDVGDPSVTLEPGMVLTIEPALTIPEERLYIRLEDMILVTATGYENLSGFVPAEPDAVERLMSEEGVLDRLDSRSPDATMRFE